MKFIMITDQQQSDRDFERQALYNQYVGYSRAAARMLWVVALLTAYLGLAMYDRSQRLADLEENSLRQIESEKSEIYGPSSWDYCAAPGGIRTSPPVEQLVFTRSFRLPGFDIELDGLTFMVLGPVLYLFAVLLYWTYLKYSLVAYSRLEPTFCGHFERKLPEHVWAYNLPFRLLAVRFVWREVLELFPIIFIAFMVADYLSISTYQWSIWAITTPSLMLAVLIHVWAFSRGEVAGLSGFQRSITRLGVITVLLVYTVLVITHIFCPGSFLDGLIKFLFLRTRNFPLTILYPSATVLFLVGCNFPLWLARFRELRRSEARRSLPNSLLPSED